jgi:hypothetical protein
VQVDVVMVGRLQPTDAVTLFPAMGRDDELMRIVSWRHDVVPRLLKQGGQLTGARICVIL